MKYNREYTLKKINTKGDGQIFGGFLGKYNPILKT